MRQMRSARAAVLMVLAALLVMAVATSACSGQVPPDRTGLHDTIPSVIGKSLPEARSVLVQSGYALGSVRPATPPSKARVVAQSPIPGIAAARGTRVDLTLK